MPQMHPRNRSYIPFWLSVDLSSALFIQELSVLPTFSPSKSLDTSLFWHLRLKVEASLGSSPVGGSVFACVCVRVCMCECVCVLLLTAFPQCVADDISVLNTATRTVVWRTATSTNSIFCKDVACNLSCIIRDSEDNPISLRSNITTVDSTTSVDSTTYSPLGATCYFVFIHSVNIIAHWPKHINIIHDVVYVWCMFSTPFQADCDSHGCTTMLKMVAFDFAYHDLGGMSIKSNQAMPKLL